MNVAITLLLTPFVLKHLGDSRYGIWALVTGLTGYFGLLDMGFRAAVTQYLARYLATRDFARLNDTASTAFVALAGCAALAALTTAIVAWCAPSIFSIPTDFVEESRLTILVVGCSVACQFVFFPFAAVFSASQRYDIASAIAVAVRLLAAGATVLILTSGYGLVALSAVAAISEIVGSLIRWRLAYVLLPELQISLSRTSFRCAREITSYSVWAVLVTGGSQLITATDLIVIGLFLPVAAITPFALANGIIAQLGNLYAPIAGVFFPAMTQLDSRGDVGAMRDIYLAGSRMMFSLAVTAGLVSAACSNDFFHVWIGDEFSKSSFAATSSIFSILLASLIITTGQRIGYQVLLGSRRMQTIATLLAIEGLANVSLSIILIHFIGLFGVALGTLLPAIVIQGLVHPVIISRQLRISLRRYVHQVIGRPMGVAFVSGGGLWIARRIVPQATNWFELLQVGALTTGLALIVLVSVGLSREERKRYITTPLRRLVSRLTEPGSEGSGRPSESLSETVEL